MTAQYPQTPEQIIAALEATVKGWNRAPPRSNGVDNAMRAANGPGKGAMPWRDQAPARLARSPLSIVGSSLELSSGPLVLVQQLQR